MRVALDATPLALSTGGLQRYTAELSRALAVNYPVDDFVLLSDQPFQMPEARPSNLRQGRGPRNSLERRWWLWGVSREMRRQASDLFHGTNFEVGYLPLGPSVVTIHDLSPWKKADWSRSSARARRRTPFLLGLGIVTMVITPTHAVRAEVIEHFRLAPSRVAAVPHGASEVFHPERLSSSRKYFFYVGAQEPRKNLRQVIEIWRSVRERYPVDLVLAGHRSTVLADVSAEPGLQVLGEVSDDELTRLYSGALALLYPSHYEGFGLPVLEAMQCGACVFISADAALREVAGDAGVTLDGARDWAEAMSAAASHPEWLQQMRSKSLARAREFSWTRTARLTHDVYQEALR